MILLQKVILSFYFLILENKDSMKVTAQFDSGKMKHVLQTGVHKVYSDVSLSEGGEDQGPSPHDLIAMSLASCTGMTLKLYSQKKGWPLENTIVTIEIVKTAEKTVFNRQLEFIGSLDESQKKRLIDIANHCPIHKVLSGKIEIVTT